MNKISLLLACILMAQMACKNEEAEQQQPQVLDSAEPVNGIRIAWDYSTLKQLSPVSANYSGYARMIRLFNGSLFCVFESDGIIKSIMSTTEGETWSDPVTIAEPDDEIPCYVPEILELQDKSLLVSYNMRPAGNYIDESKRFSIRVKRSLNGGATWSDHTQIYTAGHEFKNGCWEPSQIQLPSGEIQLYIANEDPYTQTNEQEISMFRSFDNGLNWGNAETVSFRKKFRDGMPVPLVLQNGEIIFAIEDNGIQPTEFKPAIIRTTLLRNWSNAPVLEVSADREQALDSNNRIADAKYAGAPYIRQLPSGEVILSYQSTELRNDYQWDRSDMIVAIGTREGKNFNRKSQPFYYKDASNTCLWNSVTVQDEHTVIALSSTNAYATRTGVWMIKGHVASPVNAAKATLSVDGNNDETFWNNTFPVFIGGYGPTQSRVNFSWDADRLYVVARVKDTNINVGSQNVRGDDGLQIFIDPKNLSLVAPAKGIFSISITAGGVLSFKEGNNSVWEDWNAKNVLSAVKRTPDGYQIEMGIPWQELGGKPEMNSRIGFHIMLHEVSNGARLYSEPLSGNNSDKPYTWSSVQLVE